MKTHTFSKSLKVGEAGEEIVRSYLEDKGYKIYKLDKNEQKEYLYDLRAEKDDCVFGIEVKTEPTAEKTGNFFYETVSGGKPGWTQKYDSSSKVIIAWLLPTTGKLYLFPASHLSTIRYTKYKKRVCRNSNGYYAEGHLVPVDEIKKLTIEIDVTEYL